MMFTVTFPFPPVAKGRPRFGRGRVFTPEKTRRFESDIQLWVSKYLNQKSLLPAKGPVKLTLSFFLNPPKKKTNAYPIVRPDLDNFIKAVQDACNKFLWNDDGQIVDIVASKRYAMDGTQARIHLKVEECE